MSASTAREKILAGNWKMNLHPGEALEYFAALRKFLSVGKKANERRVIFPPAYCLIPEIKTAAESCQVELGAQNAHWEDKGAFTGELSPKALVAMSIPWVLIGHSERRQYFGETDQTAAKRFVRAAENGLNVIFCVGERLQEREKGQTHDVLKRQLAPYLEALALFTQTAPANAPRWPHRPQLCLAYEPVWAIGTGKTATNAEAEDAHRFIRQIIAETLGAKTAQQMSILYGGSVIPENASGLLSQPDVDGVLVGGASFKPDSFAKILASA